MTVITNQKDQDIPLFNLITFESALASIKRHRDFVGPELAKLIDDIQVKPEDAHLPVDNDQTSLMIFGIFTMSLKQNRPVRVMMPRESWDYINFLRPAAVDKEAKIREVFCMDPKAVSIEFRPLDS